MMDIPGRASYIGMDKINAQPAGPIKHAVE